MIPTEADLGPGRDGESKDKVGTWGGQIDTFLGSSLKSCDFFWLGAKLLAFCLLLPSLATVVSTVEFPQALVQKEIWLWVSKNFN